MKSSRFLYAMLWAVVFSYLLSCGGNEADSETGTTATDTTTLSPATAAVDTTPIQLMLIRLKVRDIEA